MVHILWSTSNMFKIEGEKMLEFSSLINEMLPQAIFVHYKDEHSYLLMSVTQCIVAKADMLSQ